MKSLYNRSGVDTQHETTSTLSSSPEGAMEIEGSLYFGRWMNKLSNPYIYTHSSLLLVIIIIYFNITSIYHFANLFV